MASITDREQPPDAAERGHLRPVERVVLRWADEGLTSPEIAWRLRRSPGYVQRIRRLAETPRPEPAARPRPRRGLRPIERTVMRARRRGAPAAEIAARLRRTPRYVARVEGLAALKLQGAWPRWGAASGGDPDHPFPRL